VRPSERYIEEKQTELETENKPPTLHVTQSALVAAAAGGGDRSPEAAVIKQKMIYTSSKDYLKKALVGVGKEIQACDYGDLDWSTVLETLLRTEVAQ